MMRSMVRTALVLLAMALPAVGIAQPVEEASMALPAVTVGFAPTYIADAKGFWTSHGLKVTLHDITGIGSMNAMLAGSVDFSNSSGPTVIRANIRGQKVLGIGSTLEGLPFELEVRKPVAGALKEDSPLEQRVQALKGKRISLTSVNTIPHALLRYFVRRGGLNPERDITVVSQSPEAGIAALQSGSVDGYLQALPWTQIAERQAGTVRLLSTVRGDLPELNPFAFNIVVTRPEVCAKRASVCRKLMDGYVEGMRYMKQHPKEGLEVLARKMPHTDPGILKEAFELILKWTPDSGKIDLKGLEHSQQLMIEGGMIKPAEKLASFGAIVTNQYTR